jgi:hypothetical protein
MRQDQARRGPRPAIEDQRALFDAFDLRTVYDKAGDRLSISATLTEAVATLLRTGLQPLSSKSLRGWGSNPQPLD